MAAQPFKLNEPRTWLFSALLLAALFAFSPLICRGAVAAYTGYEAAALARPLITKALTSGVAYFLGDAIAQRFSPEKRVDRGRLARATLAGTVSHGPQLHYWTLILERYLPGGGMRALVGKIALDQTFFSLYINAAFCLLTEAVQRKPLGAALAKARAAAWPCLLAGWRFWPLAHVLTYSIVPLHLRVLWVDALEVVWVAILSTCVASSGDDSSSSESSATSATEASGGAALAAESAALLSEDTPPPVPVSATGGMPSSGSLRALFNSFDTDGSGSLSVDDLAAALEQGGKSVEDVAAVLTELDTNNDGVVSPEEFERIFELAPDKLSPVVRGLVGAWSKRIYGAISIDPECTSKFNCELPEVPSEVSQ